METATPARKVGRLRYSDEHRGRNVSLDKATNAMLLELAGGRVSPYLRRLIAVEYGRMLERKKSEPE